MSLMPAEFRNEDGIAVEVFVFFCDGCGKVVRAKRWKGRHRLGIDAPPTGWQETMYGSNFSGMRLGWCSEECEPKAYLIEGKDLAKLIEGKHKVIKRALFKLGRRVMGLQPWERAPWEKDGY